MSVRIRSGNEAPVPKPPHKKVISALFACVCIARVLVTVSCLAGIAIGLESLFPLFGSQPSPAAAAIWVQTAIVCGVYAVVLSLIQHFLEDLRGDGNLSFEVQAKRFRIIALLFVLLVVFGVVASFVVSYVAHGEMPFVGISLGGIDAFPSNADWFYAFGEEAYVAPLSNVSIGLGGLICAGICWLVAYVFDYSAWLRHRDEMTA